MRATVIRYGLIGAGIWFVIWLTLFLLVKAGVVRGFDFAEVIGYTSMVLALSMIFFALVQQRDRVNGGQLSFGQGFVLGLRISVIVGAVVGVVDVLHVFVLDPGFMDAYMEHEKAKWAASGLSAEQINARMAAADAEMQLIQNPIATFLLMFVTTVLIGVLISAVSALLLRRTSPTA